MDGTASAAADRSAQFSVPSRQRKTARRAAQDWALARLPNPPGAPWIRARGQGAYGWWEWEEGTVGVQECQESVRRFARDVWSCDARRALGGVVESHEVGTSTKESKIANRLLKSRSVQPTDKQARAAEQDRKLEGPKLATSDVCRVVRVCSGSV